MEAEIVSIGNELLWGYTVNTNAAFLSRELSQRGAVVSRHTAISDDVESIRACLKEALSRVSLVVVTGGLGPTLDDLTREAAKPLFPQEEPLKNPIGSAPGAFFFHGGKTLILLPGVPREMERMFIDEAIPKIGFPRTKGPYLRRYSLCLLKEKEVDPVLREMKKHHPELEIGIFPAYGSLQVVFRSENPVDSFVRRLEESFPTFAIGDRKVEEALHQELIHRKKRLGLAESITGGAIAARLTSMPDASQYLDGSIVAYSNAWKERFLKVSRSTLDHQGAVSRKTVEEMVEGIFEESDVDCAIAVSGVAGPSGGTPKHPVGTVYIAIGIRGEKIDSGKIKAVPDRASAIELTIQTALGALWRRLVHNTTTLS